MANTLKFGTDGNWATKKGSTLAYNSENGNFKPLPFTFDRSTSATRVNKEGLIEVVSNNEPRIDFLNDSNGALLLEPSRSNLVTYSEDFSAWNKSTSAIIITPNYGISPDGLQNSSRVQFTSSSQLISKSTSLGTGVTSTGSVYIKGTAGETIEFDTGGVGALKTLTGDWQRIEVTSTSVSSLLLINTFAGATARDIEVWGAQMEAASYATSYIPTQGSIGTRVAESCSDAGNEQVFNDRNASGVLYTEMSALADEGGVRAVSLNDGSTLNRISIRYNSTSNQIQYQYNVGGSVQASITYNVNDVTLNHKIAVKWAFNDFKLFIDGVLRGTDVNGNVMSSGTLKTLDINGSDIYDYMYGKIKEVKVLSYQTDQELINLTKI